MKDFFAKLGKAMSGLSLFILIVFGTGMLLGYPTKWLWNYVCHDFLNLPAIDFYHAWALLVLCGLLFKSPK